MGNKEFEDGGLRMNHMRKCFWGIPILGFGLVLAFSGAFSGQSEIKYATGLNLASPELLRTVPLAGNPYSLTELPPRIDLAKDMPPPGRQGNQSSCVGWALAYGLKSYEEKIELGHSYITGNQIDASKVFSPSFIYNQCNKGLDKGLYYPDAFNLLSGEGVATWADMPYNPNDFTTQPSPEVKERAKRYRIDDWRQVNVQDTKEIKAQLNAGYPVLIGARVDDAFMRLPAGTTWNSIGQPIGGHAMIVVGYDDDKHAFRLMNSWGQQWCDGGFCWVDYEFFRQVVNEAYVAKDALDGTPPPGPAQDPTNKPTPNPPQNPVNPVNPVPNPEPRPAPPVQPAERATLVIQNVFHNAVMPGQPEQVRFMRIDGGLGIPGGFGRTDQVVVHFFYDNGYGTPAGPVGSNNGQFADTGGFAACGTQVYPVPPEGLQATWSCFIPYTVLEVPIGQWVTGFQGNVYQPRQSALLAQATLFVDGFGVIVSPFIPFSVSR
jgi:hypothetical protein